MTKYILKKYEFDLIIFLEHKFVIICFSLNFKNMNIASKIIPHYLKQFKVNTC